MINAPRVAFALRSFFLLAINTQTDVTITPMISKSITVIAMVDSQIIPISVLLKAKEYEPDCATFNFDCTYNGAEYFTPLKNISGMMFGFPLLPPHIF